jgi:tRNA (cmo5U34)-methyltransferase
MTTTIDKTQPEDGSKWAFDKNVTAVFDDMLARSIPDYETMRKLVFDLGSRFVRPSTDIIDLGASRGLALQPFIDRFGSLNRHIAIDESGPMLDVCRERFAGLIETGVAQVREHNLADGLPRFLKPSLTLCVLTAMFVAPECRQRLIADIYASTVPGGALIFVEKTLGGTADFDRLLVDTYYDLKRSHDYTESEIQSKRCSLRGVLMPLTAEANEALLRAEGFAVQPFWRALNFCGWLAVKPKVGV